jgi:hypothetical protein
MVVTTHGVYEDHGVPFDFQRWTADGLRRDLALAGFSVKGMFKLTTSERFYLYLMLRWFNDGNLRRPGLFNKFWRRGCWILAGILRRPFHFIADWLWSDCRVVESGHLWAHQLYIVVAAEAVKPLQPPSH